MSKIRISSNHRELHGAIFVPAGDSGRLSLHVYMGRLSSSNQEFHTPQNMKLSAGYKEIFAKEMPYRVRKFLDDGTLDDVIPRDYVQVFLIRDPAKSVPSYLQTSYDQKCMPTGEMLRLCGSHAKNAVDVFLACELFQPFCICVAEIPYLQKNTAWKRSRRCVAGQIGQKTTTST